jgi:hypothetical protein
VSSNASSEACWARCGRRSLGISSTGRA